MTQASSMPAFLCNAAAQGDPRLGFTFISEQGEAFFSFGEVADITAKYAAAMLRQGLRRGDRVVLALPDNAEFVFSFLGAMHAGLIPVPIYPPQGLGKLSFYLSHSQHIVRTSGASMLITSPQVRTILGSLIGGNLRSICTIQTLGIDDTKAPPANLTADDIAFLQFTSGSTSRPKAVVLTYGALTANAECMRHGLALTSEDSACAWLPLYHDMGLIGFVLGPIVNCRASILMPPMMFLKRPLEWLRQMTRFRATISFAPNFAYGLCASRVRERDLEQLDLSNWRIAGCGAEPIQLATLESFRKKFAPVGFRENAFLYAYGLAENTLAVSFSAVGTRPHAEQVELKALTESKYAKSAIETENVSTTTVVSCGRPFPDHEIRVLDDDGNVCAPREVGEIVIRGPSMMKGYYNNTEATNATIRNGWLHTGDLGFFLDGELFVCGRIKDLIIVSGRNYHPSDIEWVVSDVPGVRRGRVVAFGLQTQLTSDKTEQVIVCVESKTNESRRELLTEDIKTRVLEVLGLKLAGVVYLERGSLPRTSSGKPQRNKTREMYLKGELETAFRNEGRLKLYAQVLYSQWGFLKNRITSAVTRETVG